MNILKIKFVWVITIAVLIIGYLASCTKNDQYIGPKAKVSETTLISKKVTTGPTVDGTVDAAWNDAAKITVSPQVPDPGNAMFTGYIGENYSTSMRSMYDNQYIYFLVEVVDNTKSFKASPWYFNATTKRWAQESNARTFDASGVLIREGFGEDKLSFLWNVDNSTAKFTSQTCYSSCHIFTPYLNYAVTPPAMKSNSGSGNHYTNGANEKIDMWWAHPGRGLIYNIMDDNYQDWAGGPNVTSLVGGSGNGRHFDDLVVSGASTTWPYAPTYTSDPTQGSLTNRQSLKLNDTGVVVTVPLWVVPNATNSEYILASDTLAGGIARKVTKVDLNGVLYYTGGTIDPNVGTEYQRLGTTATSPIGSKCFPSLVLAPVLKGRADITCYATYTGSGWVYEIKRLLKTADVLKQDVDFSSLQDQPFGIAYFNQSNYQHGIKPNLLLKFEK